MKLLIVVARYFALATAEFRIHCPVGSLPSIRMGWWPSRVAVSFGRDNPSFLATSLRSSSVPVRNSQPGPTPNFSA
jgi:hypothetical protein